MSTACGRPHGGGRSGPYGQGGGGCQNLIFCGRHKWLAPYVNHAGISSHFRTVPPPSHWSVKLLSKKYMLSQCLLFLIAFCTFENLYDLSSLKRAYLRAYC